MPRTQLSKVQALVRGRKVRRDALRLAAATTKIQALIRGRKFRRPRTAAATKLQTRARSQQARRTVSDLRTKRIVARSAYKSYLNAWSLDNTQGIPGWAGLELLYHFLPTLKLLFAEHEGLKIHLSALNEFQQSIDGQNFYDTGEHVGVVFDALNGLAGLGRKRSRDCRSPRWGTHCMGVTVHKHNHVSPAVMTRVPDSRCWRSEHRDWG